MSRAAVLMLMILMLPAPGWRQADGPPQPPAGTFGWIDVHIACAAGQPLAAYQLELRAAEGNAHIVGIEGGDHAQFQEPPYYDPRAMQMDRVVIAAFSTAGGELLPDGRVRVARIHYQVRGDAKVRFETDLQAAAGPGGDEIEASIELARGQDT